MDDVVIIAPISTHAPAGGATFAVSMTSMLLTNFYSRPCGRGDMEAAYPTDEADGISTHAPAGGATTPASRSPSAISYFYSRPCGRGDWHP